jgi:hypothetical protein
MVNLHDEWDIITSKARHYSMSGHTKEAAKGDTGCREMMDLTLSLAFHHIEA